MALFHRFAFRMLFSACTAIANLCLMTPNINTTRILVVSRPLCHKHCYHQCVFSFSKLNTAEVSSMWQEALAWVTTLITQRCEKNYVDNLIESEIWRNVNITRQKTCNHHKKTAIEHGQCNCAFGLFYTI